MSVTSSSFPGAGRATPGHYDPGACGCKDLFVSYRLSAT
jgi:hypothetical protein